MTECPTCGRPTQARFHTPFREKLIRLADGTRSGAELARLTGTTPGAVHVALTSLRQQGMKLKVKPRSFKPKEVLTQLEYDRLAMMRMEGLTWREVGLLQQRSPAVLSKLYRDYAPAVIKKKAGTPPATTSACAN